MYPCMLNGCEITCTRPSHLVNHLVSGTHWDIDDSNLNLARQDDGTVWCPTCNHVFEEHTCQRALADHVVSHYRIYRKLHSRPLSEDFSDQTLSGDNDIDMKSDSSISSDSHHGLLERDVSIPESQVSHSDLNDDSEHDDLTEGSDPDELIDLEEILQDLDAPLNALEKRVLDSRLHVHRHRTPQDLDSHQPETEIALSDPNMSLYRWMLKNRITREAYAEYVRCVAPSSGLYLKRDSMLVKITRHYAITLGIEVTRFHDVPYISPTSWIKYWLTLELTRHVILDRSRESSEKYISLDHNHNLDLASMHAELSNRHRGLSPKYFEDGWSGTQWLESMINTRDCWDDFVTEKLRANQRVVFVHLMYWNDGWVVYKQRIDSFTVVSLTLGEFGHHLVSNTSLPLVCSVAMLDHKSIRSVKLSGLQQHMLPDVSELASGITFEIGSCTYNVVGVTQAFLGDGPGRTEWTGTKRNTCTDCSEKAGAWIYRKEDDEEQKDEEEQERDMFQTRSNVLFKLFEKARNRTLYADFWKPLRTNFNFTDKLVGLQPCAYWPGTSLFNGPVSIDEMHADFENSSKRLGNSLISVLAANHYDNDVGRLWSKINSEMVEFCRLNFRPKISNTSSFRHFQYGLSAHERKQLLLVLPFLLAKILGPRIGDSCFALVTLFIHSRCLGLFDQHKIRNRMEYLRMLDNALIADHRLLKACHDHYGLKYKHTITDHFHSHYILTLRRAGSLKAVSVWAQEAQIQDMKKTVKRNSNNHATAFSIMFRELAKNLAFIGTSDQIVPTKSSGISYNRAGGVHTATMNFQVIGRGMAVRLRSKRVALVMDLSFDLGMMGVLFHVQIMHERSGTAAMLLDGALRACNLSEEYPAFSFIRSVACQEPLETRIISGDSISRVLNLVEFSHGSYIVTREHKIH